MKQETLRSIQSTLRALDIPAWLLYNFRTSNPIASRILGLAADAHQTRRWAYLIPAEGEPSGLAHRIEPHIGAAMSGGVTAYSSQREFESALRDLLAGHDRVAMEYSPRNALPVIARVDAGTLELVRSFDIEVVSSGELITHLEARLTDEQIESARRAGAAMRECVIDAFRFIRNRILAEERTTEYDVLCFITGEFERRGLVTDHPPNCSVNTNSANPHYQPTAEKSEEIIRDDFVLIDLWAREANEWSVFGDITWVGYVGESVPERYTRIFDIVRDARDAAFNHVVDAFANGRTVTGAELDDAARDVITAAGYGQYFVHRTGHSITTELHGAGANLDNFETEDTRPILTGTSFSIEPGIYLPGDFGVRSELDVVVMKDGTVLATSEPVQREVIPILAESSDW